ncbi:asialoglycoprotein receptor 1-like isoform X2 [Mugil cephalus]|uniref:asialoglycoprotein receptor 1-like isoform X2 n=1 Tax=Mugil cephalus TaxID=48193 RepID=UPI001FB6D5B8|nr:asialoglycoprotein receptor 1-like isoform X2 [Mugil cephalus]
MSEEVYATPDLTKKVRFQASKTVMELEDKNDDTCDDYGNVQIYDNCWAEGSTLPNLQENLSEGKPRDISVSKEGYSAKKDVVGVAAVFLLLVCCILLTAVIILFVLLSQNISNLKTERNQLSKDKAILIRERLQLLTNYSEIKSLNANLTQSMMLLTHENDALKLTNGNLTKERDRLQNKTMRTCCCTNWTRFEDSCYLVPTPKLNWYNSKQQCDHYGAHLVIISSREEQEHVSTLAETAMKAMKDDSVWIGLTDEEVQGVWKWVDGTVVNTRHWCFAPLVCIQPIVMGESASLQYHNGQSDSMTV